MGIPCHAYKVDTPPAFHQYHAEEIGYTTHTIFNWGLPGSIPYAQLGELRIYGGSRAAADSEIRDRLPAASTACSGRPERGAGGL